MQEDFIGFLAIKLGYAPLTVKYHHFRLRQFLVWLKENNLPLDAFSCEKYLYFKKTMNQKPATLNMYIDLFYCLDKYFSDRGEDKNLSKGFKRFSIDKKHIDLLTTEEIEKLTTTPLRFNRKNTIWEISDRTYLLLTTFLAYTGCRYSEARDLLVENIDVKTGRVLIPYSKNGEFRYVYVPPLIIKRLLPLLKCPTNRVFTTYRGEIIYNSNFIANLRKRARQCGINKRVYPHLFRHSMATQLIVDGVPIEQVATILGHKNISTTYENYLHLADQTVRKAMFRHELFKKSSPPNEIIQGIIESFKSFKLDNDKRFTYSLNEGSNEMSFYLKWD